MTSKIILKKSSVAARAPLAADVEYGELALNYQDGRLYYKKANNTIDFFTAGAGGSSGVSSVAGNTGVVTAAQLLTAITTVDGAGSGLDADLLDGITSASLLRSDSADTFLDLTSESGIESLKVGGYSTTAAIQASYSTSFAAQPMGAFIWHDLLAFTKNYTTTTETFNGTTWSSATLNRELFAQKENQSITVINGTTTTAARWTFTDVAFGSADWLVIGHAWTSPNPNKTILVESSVDGITWFTKHNSTYSNIAASMFHRLGPYFGDAFLRVTITWISGGAISLSNIKLLTCRPGDQGRGDEQKYPYIWDGDQNITTGGNLTVATGKLLRVGSNTVWHAGNDGAASGLDADLLDGYNSSLISDPSSVAVRDTNSDLTARKYVSTANGISENFRVGDDAWIGDMDAANTIRIKGIPTPTSAFIVFGTGDSTALGRTGTGPLTYGGNVLWHAGNDGAASGLDADLLDGQQGSYFLDTSSTAQTKAGNLTLTGALSATTKSFVIDHPTKEGMKLRYGSLEGPENGVYVRGKTKENIIELPDYWTKLVDPESITVNLTPIGTHQNLLVEKIENNKVYVSNSNLVNKSVNYFFTVFAERCDVEKIKVEYVSQD